MENLKELYLKSNKVLSEHQEHLLKRISDNRLYVVAPSYERVLQILWYSSIDISQVIYVNGVEKVRGSNCFYSIFDRGIKDYTKNKEVMEVLRLCGLEIRL